MWGRRPKTFKGAEPVRVEDAVPPIVGKEVFSRVQRLLEARAPAKAHPRRVSSQYLLSGIARCGSCGRALVGQEAKSGKFAYYVCGTLLKKGAGSCGSAYLNARKFEKLVVDKIKERVLTGDNLRDLVRLVNNEMDASAGEHKDRLEGISTENADVGRRLERLYDALETGRLTLNDLAPRIRALRLRQEQLNSARIDIEGLLANRRVQLADKDLVVDYVADLRTLLSESPLAEQKAFIRSFVKELKVNGKEAVLTYTLPLLPDGKAVDTVLDTIQSGGPFIAESLVDNVMDIPCPAPDSRPPCLPTGCLLCGCIRSVITSSIIKGERAIRA